MARRRRDLGLRRCDRVAVQEKFNTDSGLLFSVLLAVLDPRVGHTMDVLSPFIPVLCHSD